jgi:23S rRNA (uracil1939-C5)-methyltransferase
MKAWPGIFSQINWQVNEQLIACLLRHLKPCPPQSRLLDLFAGSGNLSLPLAHAGAKVWAVESVKRSCQAGEYLAGLNGVKCRFINDDAAHFLQNESAAYDIVTLDPPRAGARQLMPRLLQLQAKVCAFISCHPAALARDGQALLAAGYQLTSLTLLDMFPQTGQMECLAIFRLKP